MKTINRDKIQRMVGQVSGSGGSGGGGGADIAGYASMAWVDQNYVSKEFFARLFSIHSDVVTEEAPHGEIVEPNDLDTEIKSIESMVGHWTEQYLSALGQGSGGGGGGGGGTTLTEPLATINESALGQPTVADQIICWDGSRWTYKPYSSASLINGTITIGSNSITPLTDTILRRDYTWWGRSVNANGVVTGTITVGNGDIILSNAHNINVLDNPSGNGTATEREVLRMTSANNLLIGRGTASADYSTYLYGNIIGFRYGNSGTTGMVLRNTGHLTVNASDITDTEQLVRNIYLNVGGAVKANRIYLFTHSSDSTKDVYLEYDSVNKGMHLVGAGFYGDSYVSALGAGSGGGGGTTLTEPLTSINGIGLPSAANRVICWDGSRWTFMPYASGSGTVTSIKITVPTGFSVSPSTAITSSGTFAITFASGYSLPTTTKQTNWDSACTWVSTNGSTVLSNSHTHDNKTVLDGITATKVSNWDTAYGNFDANGNAKSALKLTTVSKKAWGRTYWTSDGVPDSISGDMSNVGDIAFQASGKNIGGVAYFDTANSRLGIGASPGDYKLDVSGDIRTSGDLYIGSQKKIASGSGNNAVNILEFDGSKVSLGYGVGSTEHETRIYGGWDSTNNSGGIAMYCYNTLMVRVTNVGLKIGGATLSWDSTNNALKVDTGFYSASYVSALGAGSGGSSGGGISMNDVWNAMASTAPSSSSEQIDASHLAVALGNYYTKSQADNRYVTLTGGQNISGVKTFTNGLTVSSGLLTAANGALMNQVRIEYATNQQTANDHVGEINRSSGIGLCLQYDNAYNVDLCHGGGSVKMQDTLSFSKSGTDHTMSASAKLTVSAGLLYVSAATFDGNVPYMGGSDIRLKDVINPVTASVEDIANVRIFDFRWKKDGENGKIHFGSAAQDWQKIFPHAVVADNEGFLSMDYAGIAVGAVKTVAQEVVRLKNRVAELEKQLKAS